MTRCQSNQSNAHRLLLVHRPKPDAPIITEDLSKCLELRHMTTQSPKKRRSMKAKNAHNPDNGAPLAAPPTTPTTLCP